jgi:hypothetical protein
MTIPLVAFLIAYGVFLIILAGFLAIHVYHLVATASLSFASFVFTLFIFLMCFAVLMVTLRLLMNVDWSRDIVIPFLFV